MEPYSALENEIVLVVTNLIIGFIAWGFAYV